MPVTMHIIAQRTERIRGLSKIPLELMPGSMPMRISKNTVHTESESTEMLKRNGAGNFFDLLFSVILNTLSISHALLNKVVKDAVILPVMYRCDADFGQMLKI